MAFYPPQGSLRQQPQSPPPPYVPPKPFPSHYIVDCLYNYTYVWLVNGEGFGFTRRTSNMVKLQDIGGTVHSGRSMVLMKDLLKRLPVIQSLLCTKNKSPLWN